MFFRGVPTKTAVTIHNQIVFLPVKMTKDLSFMKCVDVSICTLKSWQMAKICAALITICQIEAMK